MSCRRFKFNPTPMNNGELMQEDVREQIEVRMIAAVAGPTAPYLAVHHDGSVSIDGDLTFEQVEALAKIIALPADELVPPPVEPQEGGTA